MMSRWRTRATVTACAIAATLLVSSRPVALARGAVERFTAFAVDIGHPGKTFAGQVEIVVERVLDRRRSRKNHAGTCWRRDRRRCSRRSRACLGSGISGRPTASDTTSASRARSRARMGARSFP